MSLINAWIRWRTWRKAYYYATGIKSQLTFKEYLNEFQGR